MWAAKHDAEDQIARLPYQQSAKLQPLHTSGKNQRASLTALLSGGFVGTFANVTLIQEIREIQVKHTFITVSCVAPR